MKTNWILVLSMIGMLLGLESNQDSLILLSWTVTAVHLFKEQARFKNLSARLDLLSRAQHDRKQNEHLLLDALGYRLQLSTAEPDLESDLEFEKIWQTFTGSKNNSVTSKLLLQAVLNHIRSVEGAQSAAIVLEASDMFNPYTIYMNGLSGRETGANLERLAREIFVSGLPDCACEQLIKEDHQLGITFFRQFDLYQSGSLTRAIIWLGFARETNPSANLSYRVQKILDRLKAEFGAKSQIASLSGQVVETERLISHMSHDIRSPLNNIKAILCLLKAESFDEHDRKLVEVALTNCESAAEIVEDLIDYSRHRAGGLQVRAEVFNLNKLVKEVALAFSAAAAQKGLRLSIADCEKEIFTKHDKKHFRRILSNLIGNAVKYTNFGAVDITLTADLDNRAQLTVSDTGIGMSQAELSKLFTPFTRFHGSEIDGIGLGLALTKILAELNHLSISVDSNPGTGSAFVIKNINVVTATHASVDRSQEPRYARRVLLVDDEPDCVLTLAKHLKLSGFDTLTAFSVSDAVNLLSFGETPAAIISDSAMPGGGGEALARTLLQRGLNIPMIILSGTSNAVELEKLKALGVARIFQKPVSPEELVSELTSDSLHLAA